MTGVQFRVTGGKVPLASRRMVYQNDNTGSIIVGSVYEFDNHRSKGFRLSISDTVVTAR